MLEWGRTKEKFLLNGIGAGYGLRDGFKRAGSPMAKAVGGQF